MVKNSGKANLSISSAVTGTDASMFTITSGSGNKTIKPGKSFTMKVAFKPTPKGQRVLPWRLLLMIPLPQLMISTEWDRPIAMLDV